MTSKKIIVTLSLAAAAFISVSLSVHAADPAKIMHPQVNKNTLLKPTQLQKADGDGGFCACDCVNGKWVCEPAGCTGLSGNKCSAKQPMLKRAFDGKTIIDPRIMLKSKTIPGDQYNPKIKTIPRDSTFKGGANPARNLPR